MLRKSHFIPATQIKQQNAIAEFGRISTSGAGADELIELAVHQIAHALKVGTECSPTNRRARFPVEVSKETLFVDRNLSIKYPVHALGLGVER